MSITELAEKGVRSQPGNLLVGLTKVLLSEEEVSALSREYGICAETLYRPIPHWTKGSGLNAEVEGSKSNKIKSANRKIEGTAAELNIAKDSSDLFNLRLPRFSGHLLSQHRLLVERMSSWEQQGVNSPLSSRYEACSSSHRFRKERCRGSKRAIYIPRVCKFNPSLAASVAITRRIWWSLTFAFISSLLTELLWPPNKS